uniref:Uncharacterized protein n=1 Tax=Entomoneis paludosa TaxID=265537 RepID=A0A7S2YTV4_9STRA
MDVRDSIFQLDPFGPGSPPIKGLQVFQEHPNQTTKHWITNGPLSNCKGRETKPLWFNMPMLCSGTTIGTRAAMLKYLEAMYGEMKDWAAQTKCHFSLNGDDQSIHNYLFYTGQLPFANSIPNRVGIVNTAGVEGSVVFKAWRQQGMDEEGLEQGISANRPFPGATDKTWMGPKEYNLTDEFGFFTQADGTRSRVVHQADRFGMYYWHRWLPKQSFVQDPMARAARK